MRIHILKTQKLIFQVLWEWKWPLRQPGDPLKPKVQVPNIIIENLSQFWLPLNWTVPSFDKPGIPISKIFLCFKVISYNVVLFWPCISIQIRSLLSKLSMINNSCNQHLNFKYISFLHLHFKSFSIPSRVPLVYNFSDNSLITENTFEQLRWSLTPNLVAM